MSYIYRLHSAERMFQRNISKVMVRQVLENGEVIERYPNDMPYPSALKLGFNLGVPLHVVFAEDEESNTIIITVYKPDTKKWEKDFKTRKDIKK